MKKLLGFTLAEVLITLGIIGVVAAMTMPVLISNHRKNVIVTRMKKFYSIMNQNIVYSQSKCGDIKEWWPDVDITGAVNEDSFSDWFDKYLGNNMNIVYREKYTAVNGPGLFLKFNDGSAYSVVFQVDNAQMHGSFFPDAKNIKIVDNTVKGFNTAGRDLFVNTICNDGRFVYGVCSSNTRTRQQLKETGWANCKTTGNECGALIQYDGWTIADDYPVKI